MAVKVFFIAKIKDLNSEYQDMSKKIRELAEEQEGFLDITSEEIDDIEITVSTWKDKVSVEKWRKHPDHVEAKKRHTEWYHWAKGYHVETQADIGYTEYGYRGLDELKILGDKIRKLESEVKQ
jgi:heme-degrading monooxygenase HmoA